MAGTNNPVLHGLHLSSHKKNLKITDHIYRPNGMVHRLSSTIILLNIWHTIFRYKSFLESCDNKIQQTGLMIITNYLNFTLLNIIF